MSVKRVNKLQECSHCKLKALSPHLVKLHLYKYTFYILLILKILVYISLLHQAVRSSTKAGAIPYLFVHPSQCPVYCFVHRKCSRICLFENLEHLSSNGIVHAGSTVKVHDGIIKLLNRHLNNFGSRYSSKWIRSILHMSDNLCTSQFNEEPSILANYVTSYTRNHPRKSVEKILIYQFCKEWKVKINFLEVVHQVRNARLEFRSAEELLKSFLFLLHCMTCFFFFLCSFFFFFSFFKLNFILM